MGKNAPAVTLRPFRRWDRRAYIGLRSKNEAWLDPWEARDPHLFAAIAEGGRVDYRAYFEAIRRGHREGYSLSWAVLVGGEIVGHINASPVLYGAASEARLGYWVDEEHAGRGIATAALALAIDELFEVREVHRTEVLIQPSNDASLAVARKLGLRHEGVRKACIFVDGAWRDHEVFALTQEEWNRPA